MTYSWNKFSGFILHVYVYGAGADLMVFGKTMGWCPTWSDNNGQDDVYWHKAAKGNNPFWRCILNKNVSYEGVYHRDSGNYITHFYTEDKSEAYGYGWSWP